MANEIHLIRFLEFNKSELKHEHNKLDQQTRLFALLWNWIRNQKPTNLGIKAVKSDFWLRNLLRTPRRSRLEKKSN